MPLVTVLARLLARLFPTGRASRQAVLPSASAHLLAGIGAVCCRPGFR